MAQQAETEIVLPVSINEIPQGETAVLIAGEDIYVPKATLEKAALTGVSWDRVQIVAGLRGAERLVAGEPALSLLALAPWTTFRLDEEQMTLSITIDPQLMRATSIAAADVRPDDIVYSTDVSTFLNYAVSSNAFSDLNAFAEIGSSVRGNLLYSSFSRSPGEGVTRGLTNYQIDQRQKLRRITFGDAAVISDELGGSGIIGGATVSRTFEVDPYFIRFPSLALRGTATTPSEVEIYVNGVLVDRRSVPPGPFEIANVAATSGSAAATVVVRDVFGREQAHSSSFYYSTGVLARGLSEFTYSAGAVRAATGSFDYDDPLVMGTHRVGLTDNLTVGGRLEVTDSLVSAGPQLSFASRWGELDLKLAASQTEGDSGTAAALSYRRLSLRTSVGGSIRTMSRNYVNFSLPVARDRSLREASVAASYLPGWGSIGLQWTAARMRDTGDRQRLALLSNIALGRRMSLLVSAAAVEENGHRFGEYFAGVSLFTFHNSTLNVAGYSRDGTASVSTELQRPTPVGTGWGYRLQNSTGEGETLSHASIQYQNDFGRYEIGIDPESPRDAALSAAGAVVYQAGKVVPTRPVVQSFALVRVPGVAGVRVYLSNQLVGRTDWRGDLLVPNLLPYYGNRIRIDDRDVPMNHEIQLIEQTIAPPPRGGALVVFPARQLRTATGSVVVRTPEGDVIPSFGELRLERDGTLVASPIGGAGEVYFDNVSPGAYAATVVFGRGECSFTLQVPPTSDEVVELGRIVCTGVTP